MIIMSKFSRTYKVVDLYKCACLGIILSSFSFSSCHHSEQKADPIPDIEVSAPIVQSVILSKDFPASVISDSKADVVARVDGIITAKFFKDGQMVNKGDRLFSIETSKYASLAEEARAQLSNAESQLSYATDRLNALNEAFKSNAVSEMDVIQAQNAKVQAQAAVHTARASLSIANTNLGYCTVVAPVSGKISAALLDVGAYVAGDSSPVTLATIYDDSNLSVQFDISEDAYNTMLVNNVVMGDSLLANVPLKLGKSDNITEYVDIRYVSPSVNISTGTVSMRGKVLNSSGNLRAGMYALVSLPFSRKENGILVNDASIGSDQLGKYLYLVNDSNQVVYTHVEIGGLYNDTLRLITKGVTPTDRYVTKAMINVRQGMKVNPVMSLRSNTTK